MKTIIAILKAILITGLVYLGISVTVNYAKQVNSKIELNELKKEKLRLEIKLLQRQ